MIRHCRFLLFLLWCLFLLDNVKLSYSETVAFGLPTTAAPTTHIVSFVKQKKSIFKQNDIKKLTTNSASKMTPVAMSARVVQQLDAKSNDTNQLMMMTLMFTAPKNQTDDLMELKKNTLENTNVNFNENEQHESTQTLNNDDSNSNINSSSSSSAIANASVILWNRKKQSIPVLEPVKHLLNHLGENGGGSDGSGGAGAGGSTGNTHAHGGYNHTGKNHHVNHNNEHHVESAAIETEEEREMEVNSTELQVLEVLGNVGTMIWGFLSSLQKIFAASSGTASSASSSSSSGRR